MSLSRLILILAFAPLATADVTWTLTTADFNKSTVTVSTLDASTLKGVARDNPVSVRIDQVLRLDREASAPATPAHFTLFLTGSDKLTGDVGELKDDVLTWTSPVMGQLKLPLDGLRGIGRSPSPPKLDEERKEDQVTLTNHDVVRGVVSAITADKVQVQVNGELSTVPLPSADAVFFASAPKTAASTARAFRVRFTDGSQVTVPGVVIANRKLNLALPGGVTRDVELTLVRSIEQVNGPVRWLSDQPPASAEQTPFNAEAGYPAQFDKNVFGKPLRVAGQVAEKGIGVHANSRLVFALDGSYKVFRTRYGIDTNGDTARADVDVRIFLDDKLVHEQKHLRAFATPGFVTVPLGAAKTLTLEVLAAGPTDTQDRFDWIEPALVREPPTEPPVPTTRPSATLPVPTTAAATSKPAG